MGQQYSRISQWYVEPALWTQMPMPWNRCSAHLVIERWKWKTTCFGTACVQGEWTEKWNVDRGNWHGHEQLAFTLSALVVSAPRSILEKMMHENLERALVRRNNVEFWEMREGLMKSLISGPNCHCMLIQDFHSENTFHTWHNKKFSGAFQTNVFRDQQMMCL